MDSTSTVTGNQAASDHSGFYFYQSGYLGTNGVVVVDTPVAQAGCVIRRWIFADGQGRTL